MPVQFSTPGELEQLRAAGSLAWAIVNQVAAAARPGVTTAFLSARAESLILDAGATPTSKGFAFEGEPAFQHAASICVNDEAAFGTPGPRVLVEGDLVTIDVTLRTDLGWHADAAISTCAGHSERAERLIAGARAATLTAIRHATNGAWWGEVMTHVAAAVGGLGLCLAPTPCGHGIGRTLHDDPRLSHASGRGAGARLRQGMVLCIEPIVIEQPAALENVDGTLKARHAVWSAFEERMIAITRAGTVVLTGGPPSSPNPRA